MEACTTAVDIDGTALDKIPTSEPFSRGMISRLLIVNSVNCNASFDNLCDGDPCNVPSSLSCSVGLLLTYLLVCDQ
jgi:hypothetical protein